MADFETLVTQVVNEEIKRYESELAKAFQAAKNTLDQKYQAVQLDYQAKLKDYLSRAKERVEGEKAKLEIDTKRAVSQQKEAWLEKVYAQAREKLTKEFVNSKEYEQILTNLVSKNAKDGAVIYCSPRDSESPGRRRPQDLGRNQNILPRRGVEQGLHSRFNFKPGFRRPKGSDRFGSLR